MNNVKYAPITLEFWSHLLSLGDVLKGFHLHHSNKTQRDKRHAAKPSWRHVDIILLGCTVSCSQKIKEQRQKLEVIVMKGWSELLQ